MQTSASTRPVFASRILSASGRAPACIDRLFQVVVEIESRAALLRGMHGCTKVLSPNSCQSIAGSKASCDEKNTASSAAGAATPIPADWDPLTNRDVMATDVHTPVAVCLLRLDASYMSISMDVI